MKVWFVLTKHMRSLLLVQPGPTHLQNSTVSHTCLWWVRCGLQLSPCGGGGDVGLLLARAGVQYDYLPPCTECLCRDCLLCWLPLHQLVNPASQQPMKNCNFNKSEADIVRFSASAVLRESGCTVVSVVIPLSLIPLTPMPMLRQGSSRSSCPVCSASR